VDVYLLPDGPDAQTRSALRRLRDVPQLSTRTAFGAPACLNRLATTTDADLVVLLESGAIVGPHWLDYPCAALATDAHHGLAGPSTNRAWNEQCVFPNAGGMPDDVARTAREAVQRFGANGRTLEPLYSLADFCYAVRREFVHDVHGGTLMYSRGVWEHLARYPNRSLAEDAQFLRRAVRRGARLERIAQERDLFIYVRHATNAWVFSCGQSFNASAWFRMAEPALPTADRAFYAARSLAVTPTRQSCHAR
jgi:hypothetical protein